MKRTSQIPFPLAAASALVLAANSVLAQESADATEEAAIFQPLGLVNRPQVARQAAGDSGLLELGAGYVSDDNYMFGQYNGLNEEGGTLIGNLQWQHFDGDSYIQTSFTDMGLETREGQIIWGRPDRLRINVGFDSQQQVRNDTGRTPFNGSDTQVLPPGWESGVTTQDFGALDQSLRRFDRELDRNKLFAGLETRLGERWRLRSNLSYEEKEGDGDVGAAIYTNLVGGDAVLLKQPIDYTTTEFDLGLSFDGDKLHLDGELAYSEFDNDDDVLTWQNPYSSYGPRVRYPEGTGGLGVAPDNEQFSGRLTGHYIFSSTTRLQIDTSYAVASQDR